VELPRSVWVPHLADSTGAASNGTHCAPLAVPSRSSRAGEELLRRAPPRDQDFPADNLFR